MRPGVDAFLVFDAKILLVQRDNIPTISYPNLWNLPGGGIDDGERADQAIVREIKEEVGLNLNNLLLLSKDSFEDGNVVSKYFAKLTKEQKESVAILEEGQAFDFFTLDEMLAMEVIPNLKIYIGNNYSKLQSLLNR